MKEIKDVKKRRTFSERVDNAIAFISPKWALRRTHARITRENLFASFRAYKGARASRTTADWVTTSGSADQDILGDLRSLRERSRELNRNDAHAAGITKTIAVNVVGGGITPQSRIDAEALGITRDQAQAFQVRAERGFRQWAERADATGRLNFWQIQRLAERKKIEDGDVFALPLMLKDDTRPLSLALEVVEADRVTTPAVRRSDRNLREGVTVDDTGMPQSYWIKKHHPGDITVGQRFQTGIDDFNEIEAVNPKTGRKSVFHLFDQERPGQTRGVPLFAPALNLFNDLANYLESELMSARVSACFSAFITKNDPAAAALGNTNKTNSAGQRIELLEPATIEYLAPGESISFAQPNKPGNTFDVFMTRILRAISSGIGFSYELVARDYSRVNFSSARAAILEDRRNFRVRQNTLIVQLCQPTWEMVLEEMALRGDFDDIVSADEFMANFYLWTRAFWQPPGWQWVDPVKEVKAAELALASGLTTLADEAASQGRDWEETLRQQAREKQLRDELDLPAPSATSEPATFVDENGEPTTLRAVASGNGSFVAPILAGDR